MDILSYVLGYNKGKAQGAGSGGGGSENIDGDIGRYWRAEPKIPATLASAVQRTFEFNGHFHVVFQNSDTSAKEVWWLDEEGWHYLCTSPVINNGNATYIEWNGELHAWADYEAQTKHYKYDPDTGEFVEISTFPGTGTTSNVGFVVNNELYATVESGTQNTCDLYKFDGTAWSLAYEKAIKCQPSYNLCVIGDNLYYINLGKIYKFSLKNGTETLVSEGFDKNYGRLYKIGEKLYYLWKNEFYYRVEETGLVEFSTDFVAIANKTCVVNDRVYFVAMGSSSTYWCRAYSWKPE